MPWMPGRSLVDENASDTIESVRLRAAAQNRTHTKKKINALTFHMCSMHKSLWIKLPCYNDADCFALTTHHPGQSIRRTYRYTKMGRLVIMAHHRIWSHFDSHQMLKLKLGPQDNNGIIEIYNNGIYSPCSVVCLRWNVSGMLSFFRPLQSQTQQIGIKKIKKSQKLFIETQRHKRVSNKLRIAAENGALFLGARQTHSMPAAVHKQKNTNTLPFKQRDHLLFFLQRTNHFEFTQIAHMRLLVFAEFNLCHNCRLMQFQRNKLWRWIVIRWPSWCLVTGAILADIAVNRAQRQETKIQKIELRIVKTENVLTHRRHWPRGETNQQKWWQQTVTSIFFFVWQFSYETFFVMYLMHKTLALAYCYELKHMYVQRTRSRRIIIIFS